MNQNCRICLKEDVDCNFYGFSYQIKDNLPVWEIYQLLINQIENQNRDESKICRDCLHQLIGYFNYRAMALKNNEIILQWEAQVNVCGDGQQEGTSSYDVKEEDDQALSVSFDTSDDPLEAIHLAKVKMEVPDDESDDEGLLRLLMGSRFIFTNNKYFR